MDPIVTGFILSWAFSWAAFRLKFLTIYGSLAATLLGTVILGWGGWPWAYPLLAFFIGSSLLSKARARFSPAVEEARSGPRDAMQVLANGGVAGFVVLLGALARLELYPIYLGALAAANADTWSTEIGIMLGKKPRSIISGKSVPPGTSGGISLVGILAAVFGALLIAWIGRLSLRGELSAGVVVAVALAGFAGSLFDSLLGATLQARRRCRICAKDTEKIQHCGEPTELIGGRRWLNNDGVNFLCTTCGATIAAFLRHW